MFLKNLLAINFSVICIYYCPSARSRWLDIGRVLSLRFYIKTQKENEAILTELTWSIKDLLYGINSTEKNDLRSCLFSSTEKETS